MSTAIRTPLRVVVVALVLTATPPVTAAADDEPPAAGWRFSAELGGVGVAGNTESLALAAGAEAEHAGAVWSWTGDGELHVHRVERADAANEHEHWQDAQLESDVRRVLGARTYALLRFTGDHRPRSGIEHDLRTGVGAGVVLTAPSGTRSTRLEAGLSAVSEEHAGERSLDYAAAFARCEVHWTLPAGPALTWDGGLRIGDGEGSRLKSDQELELEAPLARRLSLKVALQWRYDADPPAGYDRDDLTLGVTFAVTIPAPG